MVKRFYGSKKRLTAVVVIGAVLVVGLVGFLQTGRVVEAALLDPHPGLVGWWRFDEGNGTIAGDSSGNGNNGTIYGATWVTGTYGKALSFDGIDDYVEVPHSTDFQIPTTNELSVELWLKVTTFQAGEMVINKGYEWMLYPLSSTSKNLRIMTRADGSWQWGSGYSLMTDKWYHVVATWTFNGTTLTTKLYIDGNLEETDDYAVTSFNAGGDPLRIGYIWSDYLGAIIDDVRIYNRALSASEIGVNFQKEPDFSSTLLSKVSKGTTEFIATLSWQGVGNINVTIESPSETYTEETLPVYQKTAFTSSNSDMLNIKRLVVSVTELLNAEHWYIILEFDEIVDYKITVETQR